MCARPCNCGSLSSARCAVICTLRSLISRLKPRRGVNRLHAASAVHRRRAVVRTMVLRMMDWIPDSADFECGASPLMAWNVRVAVERYHIEPAWHRGQPRMRLQESFGGAHQLHALGRTDRRGATAEIRSAAVADFHEDEGLAVTHHEIEFTEAGPPVAFDQFQARAFQMLQRTLLEAGADAARRHGFVGIGGSAGCDSSPAAIGRATPPWNCTQIGVRSTWPKVSIVNWPVAPGT